jgi:Raf kinase inhibitor-like YbhB/YbcL family protein
MTQALLKFAPLLAIAALAGCGASNRANQESNGGSTMDNATIARIELRSSAFEEGQPIPVQYTCDGEDKSPALSWGEPPPGTKSFALVVDDPDAPSGLFRHWGAYDIPASTRSLETGQSIGRQAVNGFNKAGYGGPCPPPGHGPHHYHFKLFALDVAELGLPADAKIDQVESEAQKHAIGKGELIGTYERK